MASLDLELGTQLFRLFADPTRVRLLRLLEEQALTVAELTQITQLAQSRISTHLAKLREAGLITDRRTGSSTLYQLDSAGADEVTRQLWQTLRQDLDDAQLSRDRERAGEIVRARQHTQSWADSVAGRMASQYSPGRGWEATTHALVELIALGDVLDIASGDGVLAELLARRAKSVSCADLSEAVVKAGQTRLRDYKNVSFHRADMHKLPFAAGRFDVVFLLHALTYTRTPQAVLKEATRMLKPGGRLVLATLRKHAHEANVAAYDHVNLGFELAEIRDWLRKAGLNVSYCAVSSREPRPPYFEVITASAQR